MVDHEGPLHPSRRNSASNPGKPGEDYEVDDNQQSATRPVKEESIVEWYCSTSCDLHHTNIATWNQQRLQEGFLNPHACW
jgi:hypothetical protein